LCELVLLVSALLVLIDGLVIQSHNFAFLVHAGSRFDLVVLD
jgi:hypothetical protein